MKNTEYAIKSAGLFSISDVCDVDQTKERMKIRVEVQRYRDLASRNWEGYILTADDQPTGRYYALGPAISGEDLKVLFYAPAPRKLDSYGTDSDDVIYDRDRLYRHGNEALLQAHRRMPGWDIYERDGLPLTEAIRQGGHKRSFTPLLVWGGEGWVAKPNPAETDELQRVANPNSFAYRINMLAALLYLASYSPDAQENWKPSRNYAGQEFADGSGGNGMDPAQVPALVIQKASELIRSTTCLNIQKRLNTTLAR